VSGLRGKAVAAAVVVLVALGVASFSGTATAAIKYWDTNGATPGLGGAGTWNTTVANWSDDLAGTTPATTVDWSTPAPFDQAVFAGTGGAVTGSGTVYADKITISSTGYSFTGDFRLNSSGGIIELDQNLTFTGASTDLAGDGSAGTLAKTAAGTLIFAGRYLLTNGGQAGTLNINAGTVRVDTASGPPLRNFTYRANSGGTLLINANNALGTDVTRIEADGGLVDFNNKSQANYTFVLSAKNGGNVKGGGSSADIRVQSHGSTVGLVSANNGTIDTQGGDIIAERRVAAHDIEVLNGGTIATGSGKLVLTRTGTLSTAVPRVITTAGTGNLISGNIWLTGANDGLYTPILEREFQVTGAPGTVALTVIAAIADGALAGGALRKTGGGLLTLSGANTYTGNTVIAAGTLRVTHATAGLAACKVQIAGGAFAGPESSGTGVVTFNLGATPDSGIVMTSGSLDLSRLGLNFSGAATLETYTLVDYSAGGALTTATGVPATRNTFASAANVPARYAFVHDTAAKKIFLQPPAGTVISIR
jgi:fibronectin-binding autotransporter adhesin